MAWQPPATAAPAGQHQQAGPNAAALLQSAFSKQYQHQLQQPSMGIHSMVPPQSNYVHAQPAQQLSHLSHQHQQLLAARQNFHHNQSVEAAFVHQQRQHLVHPPQPFSADTHVMHQPQQAVPPQQQAHPGLSVTAAHAAGFNMEQSAQLSQQQQQQQQLLQQQQQQQQQHYMQPHHRHLQQPQAAGLQPYLYNSVVTQELGEQSLVLPAHFQHRVAMSAPAMPPIVSQHAQSPTGFLQPQQTVVNIHAKQHLQGAYYNGPSVIACSASTSDPATATATAMSHSHSINSAALGKIASPPSEEAVVNPRRDKQGNSHVQDNHVSTGTGSAARSSRIADSGRTTSGQASREGPSHDVDGRGHTQLLGTTSNCNAATLSEGNDEPGKPQFLSQRAARIELELLETGHFDTVPREVIDEILRIANIETMEEYLAVKMKSGFPPAVTRVLEKERRRTTNRRTQTTRRVTTSSSEVSAVEETSSDSKPRLVQTETRLRDLFKAYQEAMVELAFAKTRLAAYEKLHGKLAVDEDELTQAAQQAQIQVQQQQLQLQLDLSNTSDKSSNVRRNKSGHHQGTASAGVQRELKEDEDEDGQQVEKTQQQGERFVRPDERGGASSLAKSDVGPADKVACSRASPSLHDRATSSTRPSLCSSQSKSTVDQKLIADATSDANEVESKLQASSRKRKSNSPSLGPLKQHRPSQSTANEADRENPRRASPAISPALEMKQHQDRSSASQVATKRAKLGRDQ